MENCLFYKYNETSMSLTMTNIFDDWYIDYQEMSNIVGKISLPDVFNMYNNMIKFVMWFWYNLHVISRNRVRVLKKYLIDVHYQQVLKTLIFYWYNPYTIRLSCHINLACEVTIWP